MLLGKGNLLQLRVRVWIKHQNTIIHSFKSIFTFWILIFNEGKRKWEKMRDIFLLASYALYLLSLSHHFCRIPSCIKNVHWCVSSISTVTVSFLYRSPKWKSIGMCGPLVEDLSSLPYVYAWKHTHHGILVHLNGKNALIFHQI